MSTLSNPKNIATNTTVARIPNQSLVPQGATPSAYDVSLVGNDTGDVKSVVIQIATSRGNSVGTPLIDPRNSANLIIPVGVNEDSKDRSNIVWIEVDTDVDVNKSDWNFLTTTQNSGTNTSTYVYTASGGPGGSYA